MVNHVKDYDVFMSIQLFYNDKYALVKTSCRSPRHHAARFWEDDRDHEVMSFWK